MASLVDQVSRRLRDELNARRAAARDDEIAGRVDHTADQVAYEARRAQEDAEHQRRRGPTVPRAELDRRESERWDTIATLRSFRTEIETRRRDLTAARAAAVESGNLDEAIDCQQHLATFDALSNAAASRLAAHGIEVK